MTETTLKLPSISRRPSGFTDVMEKTILKSATGVTADGVLAVVKKQEDAPGYTEASAWLEGKTIDVTWIWWALQRRDVEKRALAEFAQPDEEKTQDPRVKACDALVKRYVYSAFRDQIFDLRSKDWIKISGMVNLEAVNMPLDDKGNRLNAFDLFITSKKAARVHNERFTPTEKARIVEVDGVRYLNTWEPSKLKPVEGDVAPFLNHILYFCEGREKEANHIIDWMAYNIQNPGKKINHALLLISPAQGTGKDTISEMMQEMIGHKNVSVVQDEHVNEGRYDFMKRALLVVVPETMGGDRKDLANKLKPLITQPKIHVNEKFVPAYDLDSHANFMMFSNYENAAYIEDKDRRYFVIICNAAPKTPDYFKDLYENYIRTPKMGAVLDFLMKRDLSKFDAYAPAPDTPDKQTVRNATMGGAEAWLDYIWESGAYPFDTSVVNLVDVLRTVQNMKGPRMTIQQLSAFLKKKGGGDLGKRRVAGKQPRLWAVRDFEAIRGMLDRKEMELKSTLIDDGEKFDVVNTDGTTREVKVVSIR